MKNIGSNDALNHALNMGYSLEEIQKALDQGISAEELATLAPRSEPPPVEVLGSVKPTDFSDTGNAEVFERQFSSDALWTKGGGWFVWNGTYWEQSDHKAVMLARGLSERMLTEALGEQWEAITNGSGDAQKAAKSYLAHAQATRRKSRLDAMLGLAQAGLIRDFSVLDANPLDLNTPAGIVSLATGEMRPHNPNAFCSQITKVAPGNTGMQMWSDFLRTITGDDLYLTDFLHQVVGMSLIGKVYHEGVVIAHGGGRNGKSTFFNAVADVLGSYAGQITVNVLTTERGNKGAALATLRGKRLILTGELEEHQRLSVATLKALASTDKLVAEEKFRSPEAFKQSHTICLFTNHLPRVGSTDGGTWRRLTVVPFDAVITPTESVQNFGEVLVNEAGPAILQWAIEGAANFAHQKYSLIVPERVAIATEEYQNREDWLSNFIAERCIEGERAAGGELYAAYRDWAARSGEFVRRQSDFVAAMEAAGYRKISIHGCKYWTGVKFDVPQSYAAQGIYPAG